jgi:hypothetical protein
MQFSLALEQEHNTVAYNNQVMRWGIFRARDKTEVELLIGETKRPLPDDRQGLEW